MLLAKAVHCTSLSVRISQLGYLRFLVFLYYSPARRVNTHDDNDERRCVFLTWYFPLLTLPPRSVGIAYFVCSVCKWQRISIILYQADGRDRYDYNEFRHLKDDQRQSLTSNLATRDTSVLMKLL